MYCLYAGCSASWNATALAAMTCMNGPPWMPGKDRAVERLGVRLLAQDQPAPRAAQRLVGRRGDEVAVGHRAGVVVRSRPGPAMWAMSAITWASDLCGDGGDALEIDGARVGRGAADDQLRPVLARPVPPCAS